MRFVSNFLNKYYYHGSYEYLEVGTILEPTADYEHRWGENPWYHALEHYRPKDMLAHRSAVFMCSNPDDIDAAGGGTDWVFTVAPIGKVERHDMNWGTQVEGELETHKIHDEKIAQLCMNYWKGVPSVDPLWEYLAPKAKVLAVEEF